ncbi:MAG: protein kinase [Enhygromyxa sp.]
MDGIITRDGSTESVASPRAVKARLFGAEQGDRLHKQLVKARLLRHLQQPTGGIDTHEEADGSTEPIAQGLTESPVRVGRYAVLRKLGQGGMGVVYVAFDEDLDRKVALKLLRGDLSKDDRGRTRMLREAQALARLSHPNVVQVHEVGHWNDHDYVAMEYVDGQTLDRWLAAEPRSWREILEVLIQAGRGLEAAHAAGLVHRDFKPANLLVGRDGRARVVDFGLARAANEGDAKPPAPPFDDLVETAEVGVLESRTGDDLSGTTGATATNSAFDKLLTISGAVLGTPAYMAPEQHLGQLADALSDQFSFCVVLYEALFGQRPFKGGSRTEYAVRVTDGDLEAPPGNSGVPLWLRKVVVRGLAPRPEERWPSMTVLLAELGRDRTRNWRSAGVAAGLLVAFGGALLVGGGAEAQICAADPSSVVDTWGDAQRERVRGAFDKLDMAEAEVVLAQAMRSLDAYAGELVEARTEACKARWVTRNQTDAQLELRNACLDQRERELAAVVEVLADADREVVLHAPELIAGLGDVGLCERVDLLEAGTPAPRDAEAVAKIAEVRQLIADAHAAQEVVRIAEAKALTASAWRTAKQVGFEPLLGELNDLEGLIAWIERDRAKAWRYFVEAAMIAQRNQQHELWARAQLNLALLAAESSGNPDERLEFMFAAAAVEQLGQPKRQAAILALARGLAWSTSGQPGQAVGEFNRGLEIAKAGFVGSELVVSDILAARSAANASLGHLKEARADLEQVVSTRGVRNRPQLDALFDLAVVESESGDLDGAERDIVEAMRGYEALFGADYDSLGHGHLALANIAMRRADLEAAVRSIEAALVILDERHDEHHWALDGLASIQLERGDHLGAEETLRRAIAHQQRTGVVDAARLAYFEGRLGLALRQRGQFDAAISEFDRAIARLEQQQVEAPLTLAMLLLRRGETRLFQGEPLLALSSLERAVELAPVDCGDAWLAGEVRLTTAESLARLNIRRDDQRALARAAAELLRDIPSSHKELRRAIELSEPTTPSNHFDERNPR